MSLEAKTLGEKIINGFADLVIGAWAGAMAEDVHTSPLLQQLSLGSLGYVHAEVFPFVASAPFIYNKLRDTRFA